MTLDIAPKTLLPAFALTLMAAAILTQPVAAGEIAWPPEFAGIWQTTSTTRDCVTQMILDQVQRLVEEEGGRRASRS